MMERAPAPEDWRVLLGVALYRLLLITLLLVVYESGYGLALSDGLLPRYFRWTCVGYAVVALLLLLPIVYRSPRLGVQAHLHFIADTLGVAALAYSSGGVPNGLGVLLVLPALGCGLLLTWRMALLQAAGATLVMFSEELIRQSGLGFSPAEFAQTGLLGLMYFATSSAGSYVATRARKSEQLAERAGSEAADLSRLNDNIIESMQSGVLVVDAARRLRSLNAAALRLLGGAAVSGQALAQAAPSLHAALEAWLKGEDVQGAPLRPQPQAAEVLPRFARIGYGEQAPVLITLEDAAALRAQAQQIKLAALGRLSASIAHEIRNPLAAISHAGQLLAESPELSADNQRLLGMIQRHGQRINKIVKDVLELSRRDEAQRQVLPLRDWLLRAVALYQEGSPERERPIELPDVPAHARVRFDPSHLQQVLFNLWDNSFEHGRGQAGLRIQLHAERDAASGGWWLDCSDNGPGISADLNDKIYEPFFTTSTQGTGLGLYLCRELCEYNRAHLSLRPTSTGACFRIEFAPESL